MSRPEVRRAFIDSNVFIYAVGAEHHYRGPCRAVVEALRQGALEGETSVEVVQEITHVRARRTGDRDGAVRLGHLVSSLCGLHAFEPSDLQLALELFRDHEGLALRDAVHAATTLNRGLEVIVSADRAFDAVHGILRLDPAAFGD